MQTKFFFSTLLIGGLLASCANADSEVSLQDVNKDSIAGSALTDSARFTSIQWVDSVNQQLGQVKKGQVMEVSWRFRNTGSTPLIITSVTPGCGCTVADQPKEPIAPGAEGVIKAKFDSNNQADGPHTKNLVVHANTSQSNVHYLTFNVEVTP